MRNLNKRIVATLGILLLGITSCLQGNAYPNQNKSKAAETKPTIVWINDITYRGQNYGEHPDPNYDPGTALVGSTIEKDDIEVIAGLPDGMNTVRLYDFDYNPKTVEKVGENTITVTYQNQNDPYVFTKTFSIYGVPEARFSVHFTTGVAGNKLDSVLDIVPGSTISLPTPKEREGYTFAGWFTDTSYTDEFTEDTPVTARETTLYAKWVESPVKEIRAVYNGPDILIGNAISEDDILVIGVLKQEDNDGNEQYISIGKEQFKIANPIVEKPGENRLSVSFEGKIAFFTVIGKAPPTFTVSFDTQGGSAVSAIPGIKEGGTINLPANPTKKGYDFLGWYTSNSYTTRFTNSTKVNADITLYAKWQVTEPSPSPRIIYKLNATAMNININQTKAVYVATYNRYLNVKYKSSKPSCASVDENGIVTGKRTGLTTISVTLPNNEVLACQVKVGTKRIATGLKVNKTKKKIKVGNTFQIKTKIYPSNVSSKKLQFMSTDKKIAKVSASGKVKGRSPGKCIIYVLTTDGSRLQKKITITVVKRS
ncbi:MAG: InlB B-repeat-containing protein [Lachnospiraceae bacterium]|nr:InlB B-repeat-containing protein [Lachnospiraceae bacterium]